MKADTLRRFMAVHTWVGLVAGIGLFIAFYAGAVIVFAPELQHWSQRAGEPVAPDSPARVQALVDTLLAQHPDAAHEFTLNLPDDHVTHASAAWSEAAEEGGRGRFRRMRLDASGELVDTRSGRPAFVSYIDVLHYTAGMPRSAGMYVFGIFCILYGLALISGIVLYAPSFLADLFALRIGRNIKRFWQDAHNVIGVLSLPFHVIFAWSGAVLTIGVVMLAPFQVLVFDNKLMQVIESDLQLVPHRQPLDVPVQPLPFTRLQQQAQEALPAAKFSSARYHDADDPHGEVTFTGSLPQRRLSAQAAVVVESATGQVRHVLEPRTQSPGRAFLQSLIELHYGRFGEAAVKSLYFLLGLAGAFLFYTGNLLWIESRRRRREVAQPLRTRLMASLTLGTCLGCVAGVSALFIAGSLVPGHESIVYLGVFGACVVWALLRRPARAGFELLWLSAGVTALIPLAGYLNSGAHLFGSLWQGDWVRAGVDLTALAMAGVFARLAMVTLRRGRSGDPHSVWALPAA